MLKGLWKHGSFCVGKVCVISYNRKEGRVNGMEINSQDSEKVITQEGDSIDEAEYRRLQSKLKQLDANKRQNKLFVILMFLIFGPVIFAAFLLEEFTWYQAIGLSIISCLIISAIIILYFMLYDEIKRSSIKVRMYEYELKYIQDDINSDFFENLLKMSYTYLDQYYAQTRQHAQKGFVVTVSVAIFGAILVCFGIIAMFFGNVTPSYVTCAAGVITEFIASVFFYLYNKTVSSMSNYHNKLVLSQNISIALKVSDGLPGEEQIKAKKVIVEELLKDINDKLIKNDK